MILISIFDLKYLRIRNHQPTLKSGTKVCRIIIIASNLQYSVHYFLLVKTFVDVVL
jgi:hypothetical protein